MTKYYVYNVKNDDPTKRVQACVEDPMSFALQKFDPTVMEFSGVFVEADNPEHAQRVYLKPQENDVFVSCDEPRPTVLKRQAFEARIRLMQNKMKDLKESISEAEIEAQKLRMKCLIFQLAYDFHGIATRISELARMIRASSSPEDQAKFSDEQVYARLIGKYAEYIGKIEYRPGQ